MALTAESSAFVGDTLMWMAAMHATARRWIFMAEENVKRFSHHAQSGMNPFFGARRLSELIPASSPAMLAQASATSCWGSVQVRLHRRFMVGTTTCVWQNRPETLGGAG
jgi:hypothetical protein